MSLLQIQQEEQEQEDIRTTRTTDIRTRHTQVKAEFDVFEEMFKEEEEDLSYRTYSF